MYLWARDSFVCTVGIVAEIIRQYVRKHEEEQMMEKQRWLWRDNDG